MISQPLSPASDSDLNLFADDIVLYRVIKNPADFDQLQSDINSVSSYISGKHLKFNASKCRQITVYFEEKSEFAQATVF